MLETLRAPGDIDTLPSPDGKWLAELVHQGCVDAGPNGTVYFRMRILNSGGQEITKILEEILNCGLGGASYHLRAWSPDSRYLYFDSATVPDGAACFSDFNKSVIRVEPASGQEMVLPGDGPVSPDDAQMAWRDRKDLVLWDMNTGEMTRIEAVFPDVPVLYVLWALDGKSLFFVQNEVDCMPYGKSAIGRISLADRKAQILVESSDPVLIGVQEVKTDSLVLSDNQGRTWTLDLQTGNLTR